MIDAKDSKILAELVADGRKPIVVIADRVGLPRATVQERLRKMVKSGVIRKFVAIPDYSKIGKQVTAYVFVAFGAEGRLSQRKLAEEISRTPGVYEVSVISGGWDMLLKVRANSVEEIGNLVVDRLRSMSGVEKTETCVSFQTIKESF
ncbi:MAG: Lrp/AsnC family transcriptional regulator [Nitrososphaerota archaeon]|jgi:DNA-binding Lrp family transcriptional regulator|nr:Lrp/AsnC family transcriptional regulator [Nitrososphaerota archaeon]MDG6943201.1 Lrp/AsnC family transcriptional regulator [Nitrososphaerota archaeon]MDG6950921.1 Lrp/AsnC family transcriptional regulator [Nitrososphaerota archaeon]